ncbi:MAG: helix-turn-helix domain-containing protein [Clostridia bacterium]|nr:helix-turn-helix domain-containing protein [Clostridia bacterium]
MSYFSRIYMCDLPSRAITVYMYLKDRAGTKGECYPSTATMSRELKLSRSTVQRAIMDLRKAGFISKEHRYRENGANSSNLYTLR